MEKSIVRDLEHVCTLPSLKQHGKFKGDPGAGVASDQPSSGSHGVSGKHGNGR